MTSRFTATTKFDLYRDNTGLPASGSFEGYDDTAESTTPLYVALPAHLVASSQSTKDPVSGRRTIVQGWTARLRPGVDVQESDRLLERSTGYRFIVDTVTRPPLVIGAADVRLTLTRVTR